MSVGELEMTRSTSEVAVCCSSTSAKSSRASASSRVRTSSCRSRSKVFTGSPSGRPSQGSGLPILTHDELASSLDHLVSTKQERLRNRDPERLRSSNVYNKIEFDWLFDWNLCGLRATQNLINIAGSASEEVGDVGSVRQQTSRFDEFPKRVHRWQSRAQGECIDANPIRVKDRIAHDIKCIRPILGRLKA